MLVIKRASVSPEERELATHRESNYHDDDDDYHDNDNDFHDDDDYHDNSDDYHDDDSLFLFGRPSHLELLCSSAITLKNQK